MAELEAIKAALTIAYYAGEHTATTIYTDSMSCVVKRMLFNISTQLEKKSGTLPKT